MGTKKEVKNNKKEENVEKEKSKLEMAVDLLNESGLLKKELEFEGDTEEMAEKFMQAVESIPVEKENEIPEEVVNAYNDFVDVAEMNEKEKKEKSVKTKGKEKKSVKTEKTKDPEKVVKGKALAAAREALKGPGNIKIMQNLLAEGKNEKEIYEVFAKRYSGKEKDYVEKRIKIYKKIVAKLKS